MHLSTIGTRPLSEEDQRIAADLARHVGRKVTASVTDVWSVCDSFHQQQMVAVSAAVTTFMAATTILKLQTGATKEQIIEALIEALKEGASVSGK